MAYMRCKELLANTTASSPNLNLLKAVPFSGIGSALYHL
jgi:hypothetical protein